MPSTDRSAPARDRHYASLKWRLAFTASLAFAAAAGTLMQFVLGALGPFLVEDLGLSRAQLGTLTTLFFALGALCSTPAGGLVDRVGGDRVLVAYFGLVGCAMVGLAAAPSLPWLWLAVSVSGIAHAAMNPATNDLIATQVPPGRQAVITGVKQSGVQVGAFLAGALLPPIAVILGWRSTVALAGVVIFAGVFGRLLVRKPSRRAPATSGQEPTGRRPLSSLARWLTVYALLMGFGYSSVIAYLPLYGYDALGMTAAAAGMLTGVLGFVGIGGRIALARISELRGRADGILTAVALAAAVAQIAVLVAPVVGTWSLWAAAVGLGLTAASWHAVGMLAVIRETRGVSTGRDTGIVHAGFLVGLMTSPVVLGWSVDRTGTYVITWGAVAVAFALAAVLSWAWRRSCAAGA